MNFLKYQRLIKWAKQRYTVNELLILSNGYIPLRYSRIENAAFLKYVRKNSAQSTIQGT